MSESPKKTLTPLDDALGTLLAYFSALEGREELATQAARGRVLAEDLVSPVNVPPEDNSAMDGYALRAADADRVLPVTQRIAAGQPPRPLAPGEAARIFTGAQVPAGADTVVMQEHVEALPDPALPLGCVRITEAVRPGSAIRRCGEDVRAGQVVLPKGTRLVSELIEQAREHEARIMRPLGDELTAGLKASLRRIIAMNEAVAGSVTLTTP